VKILTAIAVLVGLRCFSLIGQDLPSFREYLCFTAEQELKIDGLLDEKDWKAAKWSDEFVDIEGLHMPVPTYNTRVKMLWDSEYIYIGAELEEPHLWGTLKQRDTIIFHDNDFEVFIDPDGDTHQYYEIEVNVLGTIWDLMLIKPYRDKGPAMSAWDIQGMQLGIQLDGTLNDPSDTDKKWTIEMALPWSILKQNAPGKKRPSSGDQWRINFSRVQWDLLINDSGYRKKRDPVSGKPLPEHNWVWSPQGAINMHMPEMWGFVQFSDQNPSNGTQEFIKNPDEEIKWALRLLYYQLRDIHETKGKYKLIEVPEGVKLELTDNQYLITWPGTQGLNWHINHEGKIWRTQG